MIFIHELATRDQTIVLGSAGEGFLQMSHQHKNLEKN